MNARDAGTRTTRPIASPAYPSKAGFARNSISASGGSHAPAVLRYGAGVGARPC